MQYGQSECARLAAACLGERYDVSALQTVGDGLLLDGCGFEPFHVDACVAELGRKAKCGECGAGSVAVDDEGA